MPAKKSTAKSAGAKQAQSKVAKLDTIEKIMAGKKAVTKTVDVQIDGEVAGEIAELRRLVRAARDSDRGANKPDTELAVQDKLDALIEASKSTVVTFTFTSIGRYEYDELVAAHQPTDDQKKAGSDFNDDTFPPVLVAAACIDPEMSVEQAEEIFSSQLWNNAELSKMFRGAVDANVQTGDIPLSKGGSDMNLSTLLNSLTPQNMESPTRSI